MKVFISADLEGISGVAGMDDVIAGKEGYAAACAAMTGDVNAAIGGALDAGATAVVVFDAHGGGRNLDLARLNPAAEIIRGQPMPFMVAGLDESFDALFLVGYHARRGTADGVMDHTYSSRYHRIAVNGRELGEMGLAAAHAGSYGVPVALVTGDDRLAAEVSEVVPGAVTVVTKWGMGRHGARCLPLARAQEQIHEGARRALKGLPAREPLVLEPPLTVDVEFPSAAHADRAACIPTVERTGARSVACTLRTMPDVTRFLSVLVCVGE